LTGGLGTLAASQPVSTTQQTASCATILFSFMFRASEVAAGDDARR
jgi:hypothetical protein